MIDKPSVLKLYSSEKKKLKKKEKEIMNIKHVASSVEKNRFLL